MVLDTMHTLIHVHYIRNLSIENGENDEDLRKKNTLRLSRLLCKDQYSYHCYFVYVKNIK
jgi:hypothetical protein